MKIQSLAIIFILIILPITILLSEYANAQIQTLELETLYDSRLITATHDAIKAFQINTLNDTQSDIANSKIKSIEAATNTFYNSIESSFGLQGYSKEELKNYTPALVYTMYDGYYIYSPYTNIANIDEIQGVTIDPTNANGNNETIYGFKPYVYYSCRYKPNSNSDFIITYSLDNYISVVGMINGKYEKKSGYLISTNNLIKNQNGIYFYDGAEIYAEPALSEYIINLDSNTKELYSYVKINGIKYYWNQTEEYIFYLLNGTKIKQVTKTRNENLYNQYVSLITNNKAGIEYYKDAYEFTNWLTTNSILKDLKASDAIDSKGNQMDLSEGAYTYIFRKDPNKPEVPFEYSNSNFNEQRKAVIRYSIESNLSVAIANFNKYSNNTGSTNNFQMPKLKETEWELLENQVSIISFLQGLNIGGKIYNGYTVVTNDKTEEVIKEEDIYISTTDGYYHRVNDEHFDSEISASDIAIGVLATDLEIRKESKNGLYYQAKELLGCYSSIVNQENVNNEYDSIYEYLNKLTGQHDSLKSVYYTALGRERWGVYRTDAENNIENIIEDIFTPDDGGNTEGGTETGGESGGNEPEDNQPVEPEKVMYSVTYHGVPGENHPTQVEENTDLIVNTTLQSIYRLKVTMNNVLLNPNTDYTYDTITKQVVVKNVTGNLVLEYHDKVYLANISSTTAYFKESAYKNAIKNIYFVKYVDTQNAVKTYDLSESKDKSVTGWIKDNGDSTYDLYIGSAYEIYSKTLNNAFGSMQGVKNITFENLNTSETTAMHYMFDGCTNLTRLDLSTFNTENVTNMESMFQQCTNLVSLNVNGFNTEKVTGFGMRSMFRGCESLTNLNINSFNTSKVTSMQAIFRECKKLQNLSFDTAKFNTSKVTTMIEMFYDCRQLTKLDVSKFDTKNVTNMNSMFYNCQKIKELDVSKFNTENVTSMSYMFSYMYVVKELNVTGFNTSKVTRMEYMFRDCRALESINVTNFNTEKVTNMKHMFRRLEKVKEINVSNFNTAKVTEMAGMFAECKSLTSLNVTNFDTRNVTRMDEMFKQCININNFDLSSFNTSKVYTMWDMFSGCKNLKTLDFRKASFDKVRNYTDNQGQGGYTNMFTFNGANSGALSPKIIVHADEAEWVKSIVIHGIIVLSHKDQ